MRLPLLSWVFLLLSIAASITAIYAAVTRSLPTWKVDFVVCITVVACVMGLYYARPNT